MDKNRNLAGIIIGAILIAIGVFSLVGRSFLFITWDTMWPLAVIGAGAAFFVFMTLGDKTQGGLAVPGSILVTIGLILLVMNSTGRWEAWSYAWALIICGVGLGILINGIWSDKPDLRKKGLDLFRSGIVLFLIFGIIMEFIFSFAGAINWGSLLLWSFMLALAGLYLLATRALRIQRTGAEGVDLFWPVLMLGVGVIVALAALGWLPREHLALVGNLWPLLLIVAGVALLLHSRSSWVGASLGGLVVVAVLVTVILGEGLAFNSTPILSFDPNLFEISNISGERITGSGNVITENRQVGNFDRVELGIPATLEIQQGTLESLTVSGEDNILSLLTTNVSGGRLIIRYRPSTNVHPTRPVRLTLTVKSLKEIQNSSSGDVSTGPLATGDFRLALSSSGNVDIEEIQANKLTVDLSSSGDITIHGSANQLDLHVSSSGMVQAGDLQVQDASVSLSSSGDVTIWVVSDLSANISSSGNIAYYGNPSVHSSITSSGRLIAKGEK